MPTSSNERVPQLMGGTASGMLSRAGADDAAEKIEICFSGDMATIIYETAYDILYERFLEQFEDVVDAISGILLISAEELADEAATAAAEEITEEAMADSECY